MWAMTRTLAAIFFAIALLMTGQGLQTSLLGIRGSIEGFSDSWLGIIMSGFFLGFLLASIKAPSLIRAVGHIRVFAAFASLASVIILLHTLITEPIIWFILRVATGFAMASLYIVIESWINQSSTNETRGQMLSIYMIIAYASIAVGQLPLLILPPEVSNPASATMFMTVSILVSFALIPVSLTRAPAPKIEDPESLTMKEIYAYTPFGVIACFLTGVGQGCIIGLAAVFGLAMGFSIQEIAILSASPFIIGGILQFPIGSLSDKIDRRLVASLCAITASATTIITAIYLTNIDNKLLIALFGLFGGLSPILYSIIVAHTNDIIPQKKMIAASARLIMIFGTGSASGPMVLGILMDYYSAPSFLWFIVTVYSIIAFYGFYRLTRRSIAPEEKADYVFLASRASTIATGPILEEASDNNTP